MYSRVSQYPEDGRMVRGLVNGQGPIGHVVKRAKVGFSSCLSAVTACVGLCLCLCHCLCLCLCFQYWTGCQTCKSGLLSAVFFGVPFDHTDMGKHYIIRVSTQFAKVGHMVRVRLSNGQKVPLLSVCRLFSFQFPF